jgi:hypothetical protein
MDGGLIDPTAKPFWGKVAIRVCVPLQCYQDLGQAPAEQFPIEKVVGVLEPLIFQLCICFSLHICIVPYNLHFANPLDSITVKPYNTVKW